MTSQEVDRRNPDALIEHYRTDLTSVLPSHINPAVFVRVAKGAVRKNPQLYAAARNDPDSLMSAMMEAARLGLEPGTPEFHLTPRRVKGKETVVGMVGYEGYIELMYRAGAVLSVEAQLVREKDDFAYQPGQATPTHTVNWFGDRGPIIGAYAYAHMMGGGTSRVVVVGPEEIARAKESSAAAERGPWTSDYGAMVLKTAIRQLRKWVPTSTEYRREALRAATEVAAEQPLQQGGPGQGYQMVERVEPATPPPGVDTETGEVIEAELVLDGGES